MAPNGDVYVSFINDQNQALWESGEVFDDQYLVVKSTDGGATWSAPTMIASLEDGSRDFPLNVDGRQTLTNYQLRAPITGNLVADPTHNGRLYFAFSDNRNGVHDVANPVTNTDIFLTLFQRWRRQLERAVTGECRRLGRRERSVVPVGRCQSHERHRWRRLQRSEL